MDACWTQALKQLTLLGYKNENKITRTSIEDLAVIQQKEGSKAATGFRSTGQGLREES